MYICIYIYIYIYICIYMMPRDATSGTIQARGAPMVERL